MAPFSSRWNTTPGQKQMEDGRTPSYAIFLYVFGYRGGSIYCYTTLWNTNTKNKLDTPTKRGNRTFWKLNFFIKIHGGTPYDFGQNLKNLIQILRGTPYVFGQNLKVLKQHFRGISFQKILEKVGTQAKSISVQDSGKRLERRLRVFRFKILEKGWNAG